MKRLSRSFHNVAVISAIVLLAGCIHKPSGPVTPWERVTTYNAVFAQSLEATTQGTIAVQESGLITVDQAKPILGYLDNVATIQKQLNAILAVAPDAKNIAGIKTLVDQIAAGGNALVGSGALGIKNPRSQQTIGADITNIANSANLILQAYISAVPGGTP